MRLLIHSVVLPAILGPNGVLLKETCISTQVSMSISKSINPFREHVLTLTSDNTDSIKQACNLMMHQIAARGVAYHR
jgi:hypothetical protein